ncbi:MAG: hypothetical protein PWQ96_813 [Clostridia bacterium]|jgi:cytoskeletal protein RodZ|nr:hypothetical protein [Clostridiales bacterium]MDK2985171.1 hypothetical protein [Clostridia bacterium]
MDCKYFQEQLSWYIDGYIEEDEKQKLEQHLQQCALCAQELEEMKLALKSLRELPEVELPPGFRQEITKKLKEEHKKIYGSKPFIKRKIMKRHWLSWGATAAVVVFMLIAANIFRMFNMGSQSQTASNDLAEAQPNQEVMQLEKADTPVLDQEASITAQEEIKSSTDLAEVPEEKTSDGEQGTFQIMAVPDNMRESEAVVEVVSDLSVDIEVDQIQKAIQVLEEIVEKYNIQDFHIQIKGENSSGSSEATVYLTLPEDIVQKFLDAISTHYKLVNMRTNSFRAEDEKQEKNPSNLKLHLKNST